MSKIKRYKPKNKVKKQNNLEDYDYGIFINDSIIQLPENYNNLVIPKNEQIMMPLTLKSEHSRYITNLKNVIPPLSTDRSKILQPGDKVLVLRYGGVGDIISSLYGIAELKFKNKGIEIGYLSSTKHTSLLQCFPHLVNYILGPIVKVEDLKLFKYIVYLDNVIETSGYAKQIPIHKVYADQMGVDVDKNTIGLINHERPKSRKIGIGIQYKTNSIIRDYDIDKMIELINMINAKYNRDIYLLGPPDDYRFANYIQVKTNNGVIVNGCGFKTLSWSNIIDIVSNLDLVIGPDSSMLHLAGIYNTPIIGLFGPFPADLRIPYYNNAIGIMGKSECSPCFRHFPQNFCKFNNGQCICLNSITPELIMQQVEEILGQPT